MSTSPQTQWMRKVQLLVGNEAAATDLSEMHFNFYVQRGNIQSPNSATIHVWNLSKETAAKINNEYTRVVLYAGYEENFGIIFSGTIRQVRKGRENATDTYVEILASSGDEAYNFAVVKKTVQAGASLRDQLDTVVEAMQPHGVDLGYVPELPASRLPRGKAYFGMCRDYLRDISKTAGTAWSIDNDKVSMVPLSSYLPDEAVVLTANTGMVGLPEQTEDGIKVRCLLNPGIKVGSRVHIDNSSIQQFKASLNYGDLYNTDAYKSLVPPLDNDGFYAVLIHTLTGDTRGQEWYSDLICLSVSATGISQSLAAKGYIPAPQTPVKVY